jgi:hypothetical protein
VVFIAHSTGRNSAIGAGQWTWGGYIEPTFIDWMFGVLTSKIGDGVQSCLDITV